MRGFRRNGFLIHNAQQRFPKSRRVATLAKAKNAFVGGADVRFHAGVVDFFESFTGIADEREKADFQFGGCGGRKVDVPENKVGIEEGHAVGVAAVLRTDLADDADFRFLVESR